MDKFDSYKILESTRETFSKTHSAHKRFLQYVVEKAKNMSKQSLDVKKEQQSK